MLRNFNLKIARPPLKLTANTSTYSRCWKILILPPAIIQPNLLSSIISRGYEPIANAMESQAEHNPLLKIASLNVLKAEKI